MTELTVPTVAEYVDQAIAKVRAKWAQGNQRAMLSPDYYNAYVDCYKQTLELAKTDYQSVVDQFYILIDNDNMAVVSMSVLVLGGLKYEFPDIIQFTDRLERKSLQTDEPYGIRACAIVLAVLDHSLAYQWAKQEMSRLGMQINQYVTNQIVTVILAIASEAKK